jgi:single-strand DNA-binding protein
MISFNQCVFVGNVGKQPGLKKTPDGTPLCTFRLAVHEYAGKDEAGKTKDTTMWLTVVAWRSLAEKVTTYVKKGSLVLVSDRLTLRTYSDKEDAERLSVEVIASDIRFLEPKPQEGKESKAA